MVAMVMLLGAPVAYAVVEVSTSGNVRLVGTNRADIRTGKGGNDRIFGLGANDELSGDKGNDRIFGGSGVDWIDGGSGDDLLVSGDGSDDLAGASGDDVIYTGTQEDAGDPQDRDEVRCGTGYDTVYLGPGDSASHNIENKDACEEIIHYS